MVVDPRESKQRKREDYIKYKADLQKMKADPLGYLMELEEFKGDPSSELSKYRFENAKL